ncbi:RTG1 Retrograde regulation protein 1 [Candida maltosa Xu316]
MSQFGEYYDTYQGGGGAPQQYVSDMSQTSNIPNTNDNLTGLNLNKDNFDNLLSGSFDIKKQLSQSLNNSGSGIGASNSGGISKPHSRRNSTYIKSHEGSDNEDDDQGGNDKDGGNERKRRDNINEKIQELLTLIPADFFQNGTNNVPEPKPKAATTATNKTAKESTPDDDLGKNSGTKDGKPNKGQILTKSVEYLQYLQNLIDENNRKEVELIMRLKTLELKAANQPTENIPIRIGYTSAERALGEIGVGPCSEEYFKDVLVKSATTSKSARRNSNS